MREEKIAASGQSGDPQGAGVNIALLLMSLVTLWSFTTLLGATSSGETWRIVLAASGFVCFLGLYIPTVIAWFNQKSWGQD